MADVLIEKQENTLRAIASKALSGILPKEVKLGFYEAKQEGYREIPMPDYDIPVVNMMTPWVHLEVNVLGMPVRICFEIDEEDVPAEGDDPGDPPT